MKTLSVNNYFILSAAIHLLVFSALFIYRTPQKVLLSSPEQLLSIDLVAGTTPTEMPSQVDSKSEEIKKKEKASALDKSLSLKNESVASEDSQSSAQQQELPTSHAPSYATELRAYLERHRYFPQKALRLKQTGVVTLSITVDKSGQFSQVQIQEPSGFDSINDAALNLVKSLQKFKPLPTQYGEQTQFVVSLSYQIKGT